MKGGTLIFFRPVLAEAKGGKPVQISFSEFQRLKNFNSNN
jgi:hypothetical protein